jgi:hypothetical protein
MRKRLGQNQGIYWLDSNVGSIARQFVFISNLLSRGGGMNTGQIKRIGKRTYVVLCWTEFEVTLQSMDEDRLIVTMPRRFMGGIKNGQ